MLAEPHGRLAADDGQLRSLLQAVDRLSPRPAATAITLESLRRRARSQGLRTILRIVALACLALGVGHLFARPSSHASTVADAAAQRLIQLVRSQRADDDTRALRRRQAAEIALARCAAASAAYATQVAATDPQAAVPMLQRIADTFPGTHGATVARAHLARTPKHPR
ncbi:MAG: hypothetical protein R3F56_00740 [Planctomycetota bacterium]